MGLDLNLGYNDSTNNGGYGETPYWNTALTLVKLTEWFYATDSQNMNNGHNLCDLCYTW